MELSKWSCAVLAIVALAAWVRGVESQNRLPPVEAAPLGLEFVKIPPGEFQMGCSPDDGLCSPDEKPAHRVRITKAFELGKHEVTQGQYQLIAGRNPSALKAPNLPVDSVSWNDASVQIGRASCRERV